MRRLGNVKAGWSYRRWTRWGWLGLVDFVPDVEEGIWENVARHCSDVGLGAWFFPGRVEKVYSSVSLSLVGEGLLPVVSERGDAPGSIWSCDASVLKTSKNKTLRSERRHRSLCDKRRLERLYS